MWQLSNSVAPRCGYMEMIVTGSWRAFEFYPRPGPGMHACRSTSAHLQIRDFGDESGMEQWHAISSKGAKLWWRCGHVLVHVGRGDFWIKWPPVGWSNVRTGAIPLHSRTSQSPEISTSACYCMQISLVLQQTRRSVIDHIAPARTLAPIPREAD